MMVDNLQYLRLLNIINCLILLIMVYQNHLFLVHIQKISSGNCSHTFSPLVDNRESAVTVFDHNVLDIICEISAEGYQIVFFHDIIYWNTLVDHAGNCVSIVRRGNDNDLSLVGFLNHTLTYLNVHAYNNAAYIQLDCL